MAKRTWACRLAAMCCALAPVVASASELGMVAANQVDVFNYIDLMDNWLYTHVGDNRGVGGPEHDLCMNNIEYLMQSYGLTVTLEPVTYFGSTYYNVVGTKVGTLFPDQEIVLGAHYDSVGNPGADDNASGTALVLETARIITQYPSDYTIRFVAFTREEQGLYGSEAYVDQHIGDDIIAMISTDMVAYNVGEETAKIYGRANSPVKDALYAAVEEYGDGLIPTLPGWIGASDHAPFDEVGIDAALLIEGDVWDNPYYHTSQDNFEQPGNLNFPFAEKMVRSITGWLVDTAGVQVNADILAFQYPNGLPAMVSPNGGDTVTVYVTALGDTPPLLDSGVLHYNVGNGWESESMTMIAPDLYEASFPASICGEEVQYYFSVMNANNEVFTDPVTAPDRTKFVTSAYGIIEAIYEPLDTDPSWTTEGDWEFGQPLGAGGNAHGYADPTSGYTGNNVYGFNLGGDYDNNLGEEYLTSTSIDCSQIQGATLKFYRWLNVEQPIYDHAYVKISHDGGSSWIVLWENTSEITDNEWSAMEIDISELADLNPDVRLRWTMGPTDTSWQYSGWNIDDISIHSLDCSGPPCPYDLDGNGSVGPGDVGVVKNNFGCDINLPECVVLDFDHNGAVGPGDVGIVKNDFGLCP